MSEKKDPVVAIVALRDQWSDDLTDDEVIALQCDYFQAVLPDPESVLWTIDSLTPAGRIAYANGIRQRMAGGTYAPTRESAFGKV